MPTPKLVDVMLDLETVGRAPGCVVWSIGAVEFSPLTGATGREYYRRIYVPDSMEAGLELDPQTASWWGEQERSARSEYDKAWRRNTSRPFLETLAEFQDWMLQVGQREVLPWSCGASFDLPILAAAYRKAGLLVPWEFWNERCHRTLKNLVPKELEPARQGTHHNALDDAKHQAAHAAAAFAWFRERGAAAAR